MSIIGALITLTLIVAALGAYGYFHVQSIHDKLDALMAAAETKVKDKLG